MIQNMCCLCGRLREQARSHSCEMHSNVGASLLAKAATRFQVLTTRMRRRQQLFGIRMLRRIEHVVAGTAFHHFAVLDHDHVVSQCAHHRQVVADEQVGQAMFFLKLAEQGDHLFLHRAIQRRGRFVQQDQRRFQHQRPGDGDALALAAGKLVRVAMTALRVEADFFQCPNHLGFAFVSRQLAMHLKAFTDDLRHGHPRAEAAERVLEHHLHFLAPRPQLLLRQAVQRLTLKANAAFGIEQAQDRLTQRRLAGTGFADNAQRLAALNVQADAVHRLQVGLALKQPATEGELHAQIVHFQHVLALVPGQGFTFRFGVQQARSCKDVSVR